ncbi:hypothetical protein AAFF_G00242960 [Aldrovandia affinis]|uniref:Uncharacterized protein n=1 Tax=Aldrovandia affinis TaxID=143900 RepID=A0AAD7REC3_9TELE|nr:hypothetical protein AAFF_G00242960 [Aldrovandia affinis]
MRNNPIGSATEVAAINPKRGVMSPAHQGLRRLMQDLMACALFDVRGRYPSQWSPAYPAVETESDRRAVSAAVGAGAVRQAGKRFCSSPVDVVVSGGEQENECCLLSLALVSSSGMGSARAMPRHAASLLQSGYTSLEATTKGDDKKL